MFVEQASGAQRERPQLQAALDDTRPGDTLVVWKLDCLARSLTQLIEMIEHLAARELTAGKALLAAGIRPASPRGEWRHACVQRQTTTQSSIS